MQKSDLPRSETPHPATGDLDLLDPTAFVDRLHACDREVFAGIVAPSIVDAICDFAACLHDCASSGRGRLVLAGAGTSGRLAWLLARRHRARCARRGLDLLPWIAGGTRALLLPVEGAEDDVSAARAAFASSLTETTTFLGISCGLSAPCVAAGLVEARVRGCKTAVFGTNDPATARTTALPGLPGGFASALEAVDVLIAPDVGPEPLTGSSRMKGGTATWLVLDAALAAFCACGDAGDSASLDRAALDRRVRARWTEAADLMERAKLHQARREALVAAGDALRAGGVVRVVGEGEPGLAAVLDASECPPTFGADPNQVRASVVGGWNTLFDGLATCAGDVGGVRELPPIDAATMLADARDLGSRDLILIVRQAGTVDSQLADRPGAALAARVIEIECDELLDAKLTLNAVSTGAFVRAGKVWGNRMIDVALSNAKLFDRAVRIVQDLSAVPAVDAHRSVVAALHGADSPTEEQLKLPIAEHLARARPGVVPLALLHARGYALEDAASRLASEPVLRDALRFDR